MAIASWAARYIGIPFVSGGRDSQGCDCYGLVRLVLLEQFQYKLPLLTGTYEDANNADETKDLFREHIPLLAGERIEKPEPGAVAVIRFRGLPVHVGIFVSDDTILHVMSGVDSHLVKYTSPILRGGVEGIYRVDKSYRVHPSILNGKD